MASERALALAERFTRASDNLVATIERCTEEQWRARCADTGWSVAAQADHIAGAEAFVTERLRGLAAGASQAPVPIAAINQANDLRAARVAAVDKATVLAALRERGIEVREDADTWVLRPVAACATPSEAGGTFDLVLFTVKTYDTVAAARTLLPVVGRGTAVLPLQNGVDSVDELAAVLGSAPVLAGATLVTATQPCARREWT